MELLKMEKKKVKGWVKCVMGKDKSGCGHTIGTTTCTLFSYRLHKFNNTNAPGPDIYQAFLPQLRALCPNGCVMLRRVALDTGSVNNFSNSFYDNLRTVREVIESNAKLWSDQRTHMLVQGFLGGRSGLRFNAEFGRAIVKMGNIENEMSINLIVAFSGRHSGGIWQQLAHCPGNQINSFRCHLSIPAPLSGAGEGCRQNTVKHVSNVLYCLCVVTSKIPLFKASIVKLLLEDFILLNESSHRIFMLSGICTCFIAAVNLMFKFPVTMEDLTISKALAGTDKKELLKKLPNFIYDEEKALEKTRQKLAQKIAELNSAIDDVSSQLKSYDDEPANGVVPDETEALA
ncbi:peroxidase N1-like protein [Tanacetum coccineum]